MEILYYIICEIVSVLIELNIECKSLLSEQETNVTIQNASQESFMLNFSINSFGYICLYKTSVHISLQFLTIYFH